MELEMSTTHEVSGYSGISLRMAAIVAGLGLLFMAILAPIAEMYILKNLILSDDALETVRNIITYSGLLRIAIFSFLIVLVLDILVAWALYILLKPVNSDLSLLTAWFRLVYTAMFAVALNHFFDVFHILNGKDASEALLFHSQIIQAMDAFRSGWNTGLGIFGLHLIFLGYLAFRSGYVPRILGLLLILAGAGYLIDASGNILFPDYHLDIAIYTFSGEPLLIFWLLYRGIRGFEKVSVA